MARSPGFALSLVLRRRHPLMGRTTVLSPSSGSRPPQRRIMSFLAGCRGPFCGVDTDFSDFPVTCGAITFFEVEAGRLETSQAGE